MNTTSQDEAIVAKSGAISDLIGDKLDHEKEIQKQLAAPLIPKWVHLIIIATALTWTFYSRNLTAILVVVPIWLMFDEILETRSKARMRAFYASIQDRSIKSDGV